MQALLVEVGPVSVAEIKLRIGYLPEQIVGYAHLSARAYQQVGVGHEACLHVVCHDILVDCVDCETSVLNLGSYVLYGVGYLPL